MGEEFRPTNNYAYITLVTSSKYIPGALALKACLGWVGARYKLVALMPDETSFRAEKTLRNQGIDVVRTNSIECPPGLAASNKRNWNATFSKLAIFSLTQFQKLVYLDSDLMIIRNIDHLFKKEHMSAVEDEATLRRYGVRSCGFNSGVMVVVPQAGLTALLQGLIPTVIKNKKWAGDQDVLNLYYSRWPLYPHLHLEEGYNVFAFQVDHYVRELRYGLVRRRVNNVFVVHFVGLKKPWMMRLRKIHSHTSSLIKKNKRAELLIFLLYLFLVKLCQLRSLLAASAPSLRRGSQAADGSSHQAAQRCHHARDRH